MNYDVKLLKLIIMEIDSGRCIQLRVVKKSPWYAPWHQKIIGIMFNKIFISLKQPQPATRVNAKRYCQRIVVKGKKCRFGDKSDWEYIHEEREYINNFLLENGGDKLPDYPRLQVKSVFDGEYEDNIDPDNINEIEFRPICTFYWD